MIKIGDIELPKEQQDMIIEALFAYDRQLQKDKETNRKYLKRKIKTLKDVSDVIFNHKQSRRKNVIK